MAERVPDAALADLRTDLSTLRRWTQDGLRALGAEMDRHLTDTRSDLDRKIAATLRDPVGKLSERLVLAEQQIAQNTADIARNSRRFTTNVLDAQRQDRMLLRWTGRWALLVVATSLATCAAVELARRLIVGQW